MALIPKTTYAGQVDPSDPAYPQGKARNEAVDGDNDGTPLEADWVNDVWGFHQHLLYKGVVTADGNPDQAGASQYYTALQLALQGDAFGWTEPHFFNATVSHNTITNLNAVNLQAAAEVLYTAPKARTLMVPMSAFAPSDPDTSAWKLKAGILGHAWQISTAAGDDLVGKFRLPAGCVVTTVRAYTSSGSGSQLGMTIGRERYNTAGGVGAPAVTAIGVAPVQTVNTAGVLSTGAASVAFTEFDLLSMIINAGTVVALSLFSWVEVTYTETRATGS